MKWYKSRCQVDENNQFTRLESNGTVEYVKMVLRTSKDTYISPIIMENKVVSSEGNIGKGFRVPGG